MAKKALSSAKKKAAKSADQECYDLYLAPFLKLVDAANAKDSKVDGLSFAILESLEDGVSRYIANIDIIAAVMEEAYFQQLQRLHTDDLTAIISIVDSCAEMKALDSITTIDEAEFGIAGTIVASPLHFLRSELIEEMQELADPVFKQRPFLFYFALSIMQLALVLSHRRLKIDAEGRTMLFADMRINLERGRFTLREFTKPKVVSHREVARKGGQKRAKDKYGAAKEYVYKRQKELMAEPPKKSKRQIAKILEVEAISHKAFKEMSSDNYYDTIYKWLLKKSVC